MSGPDMARLGDVAEIVMGQSPDGSLYNTSGDGKPLITGAGQFGQRFPEPNQFSRSGAKVSRRGDIIVCIRATIGDLNWSDREYFLGRGVAAIRTSNGLDANYAWHALQASKSTLESKASGSTFKQIRREDLEDLELRLPPLSEQRRVAAILDKADMLRGRRQKTLMHIDDAIRSLFEESFGDPIANPKKWSKENMGSLMRIRRGGSPRPIEDFLGGTINWIKIGDATAGDDIYLSHCEDKITEAGLPRSVFLKAGSVIFANCGVSLGFARILKIDGCIHDGWLSFEDIPEGRVNKLFLLKALNTVTTRFRKMAPEGTQPNLNTTLMKDFEIILPPVHLQNEFARQLGQLEGIKAAIINSAGKLDNLFNSLQHQAFRGEP